MTQEEKKAWIRLITTAAAFITYVVIVLAGAGDRPLAEMPYVRTMVTVIVVSILTTIAAFIIVDMAAGESARRQDQRDREIRRFGEFLGMSLFVLGGGAAMVIAMAEVDHFWIANTLFLTWSLSVVVGAIAKAIAYRHGFQRA